MNFLPDVYVECEECKGKRYNAETLDVTFRGHSIADVLDMTIDEAVDVFEHHPKILQKLQTLQEVGLGYIKLGAEFHHAFRRGSAAHQTHPRTLQEGDGEYHLSPR